MRRPVAWALTAAVFIFGVAGEAAGLTIRGTTGPDRLTGTPAPDAIFGREGDDRLFGLNGPDLLHGGPGSDSITAGNGDDRIAVHADGTDGLRCGAGTDLVNVDGSDRVGADCEIVARQLSRDRYRVGSQHETQVEPDSFAFGTTIVTAFQSGRFVSGGAVNIGWASSTNGGRNWRSGFLPAVSQFSNPGGEAEFVTDPVVAYDAAHRVWLISTLAVSRDTDAFLVSRSTDARTWSRPFIAALAPSDEAAYDKEWITCDNWSSSRFRGNCYLVYLDTRGGRLEARVSRDGGRTWSGPVGAAFDANNRFLNGAFPVVRPDGTLLVLYTVSGFAAPEAIEVVRSTDGGASFGAPRRVASIMEPSVRGMRAPLLVSAEIDAGGTVYAAWHDCEAQFDCATSDILLTSSRDGVSWTTPRRIPTDTGSETDYFIPGLAVDPASSGQAAQIAITYYALPQCGLVICQGADAYIINSRDAGATWSRPQRLTAESMSLFWMAESNVGRMLADYISTSFVAGRPMPVYAAASAPVGEEFRQSIFAGTRVPFPGPTRR